MQIDTNDRTVIVSNKALVDSETAHFEAVILFSVMVYPENPKKQEFYRLGIQRNTLDLHCSPGEEKTILQEVPELTVNLALDRHGTALDTLYKTIYSRKTGLTGSLVVRGSIAGQLLCILVKPHIESLEETYQVYRDNFQPGNGVSKPSTSLLKTIWREFKFVSHLWASYCVCKEMHDKVIFQGIANSSSPTAHPQAGTYFLRVLQVAAFFRNQLIESTNSSTRQPHIKDIFTMWNIVTEDKHPISPVELTFTEKN